MHFSFIIDMFMRHHIFCLVFSVCYIACGVEPAADSKVAEANSATADVAEEAPREPLEEKPRMGITTPVVLIASSAAVALCLTWLKKHCAIKIYRFVVKPRWRAKEWAGYDQAFSDRKEWAEHDQAFSDWKEWAEHDQAFSDWMGSRNSHSRSTTNSGYDNFGDFERNRQRSHKQHRDQSTSGSHGRDQHAGSGGARSGDTTSGGARSGDTTSGGTENNGSSNSWWENAWEDFRYKQGGTSPYTRDPYEVFGLSRDASREEVKKKYRELAKRYHPDKNPGDKVAEEKFKEVSAAYEQINEN